MNIAVKAKTGTEVRQLARAGAFSGQTAGQAPDYLQGNLVILPAKYAGDFLQFCRNNPKPCPLIGLSKPGNAAIPELGDDLDIRTDVPLYRIYKNGKLIEEVEDITERWSNDLVSFVLGCSFSFEDALIRSGFKVANINKGTTVPMFKTNIQTIPGGIFQGPMVVSMRPYKPEQVPHIFDLCSKYPHAHGTPLYWGDPAGIGISDLGSPDFGDPAELEDGQIPVFWACGVTPQAALEAAKPDLCITHSPGHMLVTDIRSGDMPNVTTGMRDLTINNT